MGDMNEQEHIQLAAELLGNMKELFRAQPHRHMSEALHGSTFALHFIAMHEGDVLPGQLCQEMCVSSARVATALNNLESKGMITRRMDPQDRRKILVTITPEGRAFAEQQYHAVVEGLACMLGLLGEQDAQEYVRITRRLADITAQD